MPRLLYVTASPRGELSESRQVADAYLEALNHRLPNLVIDRFDVFDPSLVRFAAEAATAKMDVIAARPVALAQRAAWEQALDTASRLQAADIVLVTVPMWNGGVPWALKLFIDTVTQPGVAFRFTPGEGYQGLLAGRRAVVVYTSQVYYPGAPSSHGSDFHSTYFEDWLRFIGIGDIDVLRLQPSRPDEDLPARRAQAITQARALAGQS